MCDLCRELDSQIERCRKIKRSAPDELMREAVVALIASYEEDKAQLHGDLNGEVVVRYTNDNPKQG
jgi:metal-responsive CopG/Arc/MetJ family transcriptional regulator